MTTSETKSQNYLLRHFVTAMIWTLIIVGSLIWKYHSEQRQSVELASNVAQAYLYRDMAFRHWSASHGGVYVPISEHTLPNPLLSHISERDVTLPSGKKLTLMNPVYMLTQIMNDYNEFDVPKGKVTTFPDKLLNPENMPDEWELGALQTFRTGVLSVNEVTEINGIPHFRLMMPLFMKSDCLLCHKDQSYKVGDLSGALGVSVSMTPYIQAKNESLNYLYITYGIFWLGGLVCVVYFFYQAKLREQEQKLAESQLLQLNQKLEKLSYEDSLTNIANRRSFDKALHREWRHARRNQGPLSLIMIDVDHFKIYNDFYGHQQGDECLKRIAQNIAKVIKRPNDMVARYGGEEFVLLLPATKLEDAMQLAVECRRRIMDLKIAFPLSEAAGVVTISLGVSTMIPSGNETQDVLLEKADRALYSAKKMGRNCVDKWPS